MGIVTSWLSIFAQPDFVIGTTLTLFFGFLSFYFYFKGKRIKEISFTVEKICLSKQDALIEGLTFQYKGKGYDSISVSDVINIPLFKQSIQMVRPSHRQFLTSFHGANYIHPHPFFY